MRVKHRQAPSTAAAQPPSRASSEDVDRALADLPALKALVQQCHSAGPLIGARIAVLCPATDQVAALVETLTRLGAQIRWVASDLVGDTGALAARKAGWPVLTPDDNTIEAHLSAIQQLFEWQDGGIPNLIIDTDGKLARLIHLGVRAEAGGKLSSACDNEAAVCRSIRRHLAVRSSSYSTAATNIIGLSECTARGAERLRQIEKADGLMFPAIDASSSGLPGRTPDRSRIATQTLEGLLARQALAQIELFSNRSLYPPGVHRFPAKLKQALSELDVSADTLEFAARHSDTQAAGDRHRGSPGSR